MPNDSSELSDTADFDFSALDAATASEPPPDGEESNDVTPETKMCPTCERPIVRTPGMRGRLPKYHPECKPSATRRLTGTDEGTRRKAGNPKAVREADEVIEMLRPQLFKAALMLSAVDQFDAFVVLNSIPNLCSSLHGVLVRYDSLRKDALSMKAGGSIVGLIVTGLTMVLPILAHHGLIPGQRLQEMLVNFPVMMFKLAKRMKEGEQALSDMMDRVSEEMLRPKNAPNAPNGTAGSNAA